jgi:hypothetical protein
MIKRTFKEDTAPLYSQVGGLVIFSEVSCKMVKQDAQMIKWQVLTGQNLTSPAHADCTMCLKQKLQNAGTCVMGATLDNSLCPLGQNLWISVLKGYCVPRESVQKSEAISWMAIDVETLIAWTGCSWMWQALGGDKGLTKWTSRIQNQIDRINTVAVNALLTGSYDKRSRQGMESRRVDLPTRDAHQDLFVVEFPATAKSGLLDCKWGNTCGIPGILGN